MSDCRIPMPTDRPKVCMGSYGPVYLEQMGDCHRGWFEPEYIGGQEAWRCPICGMVYAFPKRSYEDDDE